MSPNVSLNFTGKSLALQFPCLSYFSLKSLIQAVKCTCLNWSHLYKLHVDCAVSSICFLLAQWGIDPYAPRFHFKNTVGTLVSLPDLHVSNSQFKNTWKVYYLPYSFRYLCIYFLEILRHPPRLLLLRRWWM